MDTNSPSRRYSKGGSTVVSGMRYGWWERAVFTQQTDDITLTISSKYNRRPDLMAYDAYGSSSWMWLVMQYNCITDINTQFITGKTIRIPNPKRVALNMV